jgi:DNA-binding NarL/FixJ family response regulator
MRKSSLQRKNDLNERQKLLSPRQQEVFYYLNRGLRNTEIAYLMKMRADTVKEYKKIIFQKLGIQNSMDFLRYRGLLDKIGPTWNRTPNAGSDAPDGREG